MNNLIWLIRASQWARNPPSKRMVMLVLIILGIGIAMLALEKLGLWPEWAMLEHGRGRRVPH